MQPFIVKFCNANAWIIRYPGFPADSYEGWSQPFYDLEKAKLTLMEAIELGTNPV